MSDLIDRHLIADLVDAHGNVHWEDIVKLPSAEPIRCRDCANWNTVFDRNKAEYGLCKKRTQLEATRWDDFCSYAERRTDE